jgi:hypothetical protein
MDLDEIDDSYEPEKEPAGLVAPILFQIAMLVLSSWIAKSHAGVPNIWWSYLAFSVAATGVGMLVVSLRDRHDLAAKATKLLGVVIGFVCISHVLQLTVDGKQGLGASDLDIKTQLAPGVITCDREHYEERTDDLSAGPPEQIGWEEFYTYVIGGRLYRQRDYVRKPYYRIGKPVYVIYDMSHPERARLVTPDETLPEAAADAAARLPRQDLPHPDPAAIAC